MRFMILVKASKESESGAMPDEQALLAMGKFNEELVKAGVMLVGEGLSASREGVRVRFEHGKTTVVDGPFAETKELVAGYWVWQVRSRDEAIAWLRRAPFQDAEIEIRRITEMEDFGAAATPEVRAQEERLRSEVAANAKK